MLFNPTKLLKLIYEAPHRTGKTLRSIAYEMGVDERKLGRETNPDDLGAKLGIADFVPYMAETDLVPLDYIESTLNRVAIPVPAGGLDLGNGYIKHIANVTKETGEAVSKLAEAVADGKLTRDEKEKCREEVYEAIQALAALWHELGAKK